jgi:hypothetical protein
MGVGCQGHAHDASTTEKTPGSSKQSEPRASLDSRGKSRPYWDLKPESLYRLRCFGPQMHRGADKSLARPTTRCILFDGENISFDASLVIYINSTNIPPIMIINGIYVFEHKNLLSL